MMLGISIVLKLIVCIRMRAERDTAAFSCQYTPVLLVLEQSSLARNGQLGEFDININKYKGKYLLFL